MKLRILFGLLSIGLASGCGNSPTGPMDGQSLGNPPVVTRISQPPHVTPMSETVRPTQTPPPAR